MSRDLDSPPKQTDAEVDCEIQWRKRYESLLQSGYILRPRYRPGWEEPWGSIHEELMHEQSILPLNDHLLDASRVSDGKAVFLKVVQKSSPEIVIGRKLASEALRNDPLNHSIPLLDVLDDPCDEATSILVFPVLRRIEQPYPASIRECIDFMGQALEGLVFLHNNKIAHRDCAWGNIMMDARAMFPEGWHPMASNRLPDGRFLFARNAENPSRTLAGGVRYYFIDFGISTMDQDQAVGIHGQERAPELSNSIGYDPYKLDVYILGMMFRRFLVEEHSNIGFIVPLISRMTLDDPAGRLTAAEALQLFQEIRVGLGLGLLSQRLLPIKPEPPFGRFVKDIACRVKDTIGTVRGERDPGPLP